MPVFAVIASDEVANVIIADTLEIAAEVSSAEVMEVSEGVPGIGWSRVDGEWRPPSPFPSWIWDGTAWQAPIVAPSPSYTWDEDAQDWVRSPQPFPSHSWNAATLMWEAPVPMPTDAGDNEKYLWSEELTGWVLVQDGPDL